MRAAERGFLLLTSHLGDPECKPLTVAQFRNLAKRVQEMEKPDGDRELTGDDLMMLGYGGDMAERILYLLSRQEQMDYYVNQAAQKDCYPISRISRLYPELLRKRLGMDCPGVLWAKGDSSLLKRPAVALVGSRELRLDNLRFAEEAGRQAAKQGYVLISGNARGADRAAQDSCLQNGGQVISIVADSLAKCKDTPGVLYLSEDGFDLSFSSIRALSRNRLIHSMGLVTLVAQCTCGRGGTWTGTSQNLRHNWSPVFFFQDCSDAVRELITMGADAVDVFNLTDLPALQKQNISFFD